VNFWGPPREERAWRVWNEHSCTVSVSVRGPEVEEENESRRKNVTVLEYSGQISPRRLCPYCHLKPSHKHIWRAGRASRSPWTQAPKGNSSPSQPRPVHHHHEEPSEVKISGAPVSLTRLTGQTRDLLLAF
uniref:Uncharacterized protein n=1 Tax=Mustela putorius furo TaxID=9669 RepID=M3YI35_MUSPF